MMGNATSHPTLRQRIEVDRDLLSETPSDGHTPDSTDALQFTGSRQFGRGASEL